MVIWKIGGLRNITKQFMLINESQFRGSGN